MTGIVDERTPVVTGMAWSTPLGDGLEDVWAQLLAGAGALRTVPSPVRLRNERVALVPGLDLDLPATERQVRITANVLTAALRHAGLAPDRPGVRLVLGTSYAGDLDDPDAASLHTWAVQAGRRAGLAAVPLTVSTACSAGADAIAIGAELIRAGAAEVCVCGGSDVVTPAKRLGHSALGTMSADTLRAFDEHHDGMLLGEGGAALVLESPASARTRSARVHAVLRGAGAANDATGLTAPDPTGRSVRLAVRRALRGSGVRADQIAAISAHGTGTPVNDAVEAVSLSAVFAGCGPVVFATKGALGHSLGATGAIEAVTLVLALRDRVVPPVRDLVSPSPDMALPLPVGSSRPLGAGAGLSLTLGFGGFNTCLLLETDQAA